MRLHNTATGDVEDQRTVAAPRAQATTDELALRATIQLLPQLTQLAQVVDISGLTSRAPAAIDNWLLGEREYRQSRMESAFRYLTRAVAEDSLLAPAALRAAITASWTNRTDTSLALVRLALRHAEALPPHRQPFALALERYLSGRADDAMAALRPLLAVEPPRASGTRAPDSDGADAWMLAGEIQMHLLPTVGVDSTASTAIPPPMTWPLESFAEQAFERSRGLDPGFSPPLVDLSEIAARRGDAETARRLADAVARTNPDSMFGARAAIADGCLRRGPRRVDWAAEARRSARVVFRVGAMLQGSTDVRARQCALSAFGALLAADTAPNEEDWSSLLALHAMHVAHGEGKHALRMVDSAIARGLTAALGLYVVDAAAGLEVGDRPVPFIAQLAADIEARRTPSLWLLTLWSARSGDTARLAGISAVLERRAARSGDRLDSLMARVSAAYLLRARGDTDAALRRFAELRPTAAARELEGTLWESLAPERLEYARLLLAAGDAPGAHRVASTFDHPRILIHQLFLAASLELRAAAARVMGDTLLERRAVARIAALRATASK